MDFINLFVASTTREKFANEFFGFLSGFSLLEIFFFFKTIFKEFLSSFSPL